MRRVHPFLLPMLHRSGLIQIGAGTTDCCKGHSAGPVRWFPAWIWYALVYSMYAKWNTFPPNSFENVQLRNNLCPQLFCSSNSHWHLLWEFVLGAVFSKPKYYLSSGRMEVASQAAEGRRERADKRRTPQETRDWKPHRSNQISFVLHTSCHISFTSSSFRLFKTSAGICHLCLCITPAQFTGLLYPRLFSNTSMKWSENALWFCT